MSEGGYTTYPHLGHNFAFNQYISSLSAGSLHPPRRPLWATRPRHASVPSSRSPTPRHVIPTPLFAAYRPPRQADRSPTNASAAGACAPPPDRSPRCGQRPHSWLIRPAASAARRTRPREATGPLRAIRCDPGRTGCASRAACRPVRGRGDCERAPLGASWGVHWESCKGGTAHSRGVTSQLPPDPEWPPPGHGLENPNPSALWLLDRATGRLFICARLSDAVRAIDEGYPHRLPGRASSSAAQLEYRRALAQRIEAELMTSPFPQSEYPALDPTTDGSLLRALARWHQVSYGRL